ncbi:undecaprenyl/decaprenyl-phosphate alpha-N-acetylglucosaminyl 1-phosphate transferase [Candidatus Sumerlaeota bacterium]|nr:undecaprenyl/decaprenyl-phosphate alpha-N-acetylglucosaminyl 1-phosphate transferase [Candidatus Sumerlaeota bacterium]
MTPLHTFAMAAAAFLQPLLIGLALVPLAKAAAGKLGLIDQPNLERKQHGAPMPRSGGIAIFIAFWGVLWLDYLLARSVLPSMDAIPDTMKALAGNLSLRLKPLMGLFLGSSIIFTLGLLDDRYSLPPLLRLLIQLFACVPLIATGIVLKVFLPAMLAVPITVLWVLLLTNSFNFLDNMNGLSSGIAIIICVVLGIISFLAREWYMVAMFAMFAGAIMAFWFFNFPKASIFLGDAGSTHLGFFLAALSILCTYYKEGVPTRLPILIPLITFGVPVFDMISVLWIRWRNGKPLMVGDTNHFSHRLVALGMTRTEAVLFIYVATLVVGLAAIPLRQLDAPHGIVLAIALCLIFLLLHWLERGSYRRNAPPPPPA